MLDDSSYRQPKASNIEGEFNLILSLFHAGVKDKEVVFEQLRSQISSFHNSEIGESAMNLIKTYVPQFVNACDEHLQAVWEKLKKERKFDVDTMPTTAE